MSNIPTILLELQLSYDGDENQLLVVTAGVGKEVHIYESVEHRGVLIVDVHTDPESSDKVMVGAFVVDKEGA
jgi:midasin (ATPase involved in ribosome maturation)